MSFTLDRALMMLERTPAALDAALRGLPDDWVGDGANREDWDPRAVVGHLIHGEIDDWVARGRIILNDGELPDIFRLLGCLGDTLSHTIYH